MPFWLMSRRLPWSSKPLRWRIIVLANGDHKIKKTKGPLVVELERNPDIIAEIGKKKGR
jgi:hypothetical protein